MKQIYVMALAGAALFGANAMAEVAKPAAAASCAACHGMNGEGQSAAGFPRLAGLSAAYLEKQLTSFTDGSRNNPIMMGMAAALSPDDKRAVSAYFASLPAPAKAASALPQGMGQQLAERGDWDNNIPSCFSCHGPGAMGVGDNFPALAGQSAMYISNQLKAWKQGLRKNDPDELMKTVAMHLSDEQIEAVSSYLAALPVNGQ